VRLLDEPQQPFFFRLGPARWIGLGGTGTANLLIDGSQLGSQILESMKLSDFLGCLAKCGRSGERLGYALAFDLAEQTKLRVARTIRASTMTGRPSAAAWDGGYGTGPEFAQGEELFNQAWPIS